VGEVHGTAVVFHGNAGHVGHPGHYAAALSRLVVQAASDVTSVDVASESVPVPVSWSAIPTPANGAAVVIAMDWTTAGEMVDVVVPTSCAVPVE
jgi:hypothetical protein